MLDDLFLMYQMECEGDLLTRRGRLNKAIKELAAADDPNDYATQLSIFTANDLLPLNANEIEYIENEVDKWVE
jgi:hypothetical protein